MDDIRNDDTVQHGIDDNPNDDAKKGLELGALGGGTVGAIAGSVLGPLGTIVGALIGGSVGSVASGAAVAAVDTVDNDNTVSGIGDGATTKDELTGSGYRSDSNAGTGSGSSTTPDVYAGTSGRAAAGDYESGSYVGGTDVSNTGASGHNIVTGGNSTSEAGTTGLGAGAIAGGLLGAAGGPVGAVVGGTLGSLAGGVAGDAAEAADDTSGTAKGKTMNNFDSGNDAPGIQTGGMTTAGSDTRGLTEKVADTITGDHTDDKTGGNVDTGTADNARYAQLAGNDYSTRPYGTYEGRSISRADYNTLSDDTRQRVQLLEEELHVDKEMRQIGEVEVSKRVVSEQVQVPVTLEREEVIIHRRDVSGGDASGANFGEQTIVVPISEEVANVSKTTHVTGEVEIERRTTTEQKTISDSVRREELNINEGTTGGVRVEDDTNRSA